METLEITLKEDKDTQTLHNGMVLRLRLEPDVDTTVEDDEFNGKFEWSKTRPSGFNGNAEVIRNDRGGNLWWQPSEFMAKRGTPEFDYHKGIIMEQVEYGYVVLFVELCEGTDYYGADIVRDSEILGGVMATDGECIAYWAKDLAKQLIGRI